MDTVRGPICGVENCRSKNYHLGDDGFTYCHYGHKKDVGLVTIHDEFQDGGMVYSQTTRLRAEKNEKVDTFLRGREAMMMYLKCFQLILWKQASWLVKEKGLPEELETVIHDLWILRLQILQALIEDPDEVKATKMFSTQSETEDTDADLAASSVTQARLRQRAPLLIETLSICYLSMVLMRLPICQADVQSWIVSEDFPFVGALRHLPQEMKQRLPLSLRGKFYLRTGPAELEKFQVTVTNLAWAFQGAFDMTFPAINHHLLLFRFVSDLALPLDVFPAVDYLARILDHNFKFPTRPSRRSYLLLHRYPETQLLCTLMVVTKLFYPFDSDRIIRHPTSAASPAALIVDWNAWNEAHAQYNGEVGSSNGGKYRGKTRAKQDHAALLETTEDEVFGMSGAQLDAYLDWFDRMWLDGGGANQRGADPDEAQEEEREAILAASSSLQQTAAETEFRRALFRLFPRGSGTTGSTPEHGGDIEPSSSGATGANADEDLENTGGLSFVEESEAGVVRIRAVQRTLLQRTAVPGNSPSPSGQSSPDSGSDTSMSSAEDESDDSERTKQPGAEILRPGSRCKHYRSFEDVPDVAKVFFEESARLVGLKAEELVVALFQVEMKLQRWIRRKKREERVVADGDAEMAASFDSLNKA